MAQLASSKNVEPETTFTILVQITTTTTAGKTKNGNGYYDVEVPSRGPDIIVEWTSTTDTLDDLIDKAHRLLKLYGGTIGFIVDAPHVRGVLSATDPDPKNRP